MRLLFFPCVYLLLMVGCAPGTPTSPTGTPDPLLPFVTSTPTLTPAQPTTPTPEIVLPSPTPLTYTIESGDTLGQVAEQFGVRLDDLLAANPGISPVALSIGTVIIIPNAPISTTMPAPTLPPVTLKEPDCYFTLNKGMWCFLQVDNPGQDLLENLMAQVTLVAADGTVLTSQTALAPLNTLPPGKRTALSTYFAPPLPAEFVVQTTLTTAIRLLSSDTRYARLEPGNLLVQVDWPGTTAQVTGTLKLANSDTPAEIPAGQAWVAAVAYDANGKVLGTTRWESDQSLTIGTSLPFSFQVSSLGPSIERVDVQAEARPQTTPQPTP